MVPGKSYYDILEVAPTATADEIRRAFREAIARYHPDKVQHLGREFQVLAEARSAELTTAYRTLTDPRQRAEYDRALEQERLRAAAAAGGGGPDVMGATGAPVGSGAASPFGGAAGAPFTGGSGEPFAGGTGVGVTGVSVEGGADGGAAPCSAGAGASAPTWGTDGAVGSSPVGEARTSRGEPRRPADAPPPTLFEAERASRDALLGRAALGRFRRAAELELGRFDTPEVAGFDVACAAKARLFSRAQTPLVVARFVSRLDGAAVTQAASAAARAAGREAHGVCVFLLGARLGSRVEISAALADQRRRRSPARVSIVAVDVRDWQALVPPDAPQVATALVQRLKEGK